MKNLIRYGLIGLLFISSVSYADTKKENKIQDHKIKQEDIATRTIAIKQKTITAILTELLSNSNLKEFSRIYGQVDLYRGALISKNWVYIYTLFYDVEKNSKNECNLYLEDDNGHKKNVYSIKKKGSFYYCEEQDNKEKLEDILQKFNEEKMYEVLEDSLKQAVLKQEGRRVI